MSTKKHVSPTVEEYLEQIFRLEQEHGIARTKHLAEKIGVSLGTVTNTIEALKRKKLVIHEPYKGVKLMEAGRQIALNVIRKHRLCERLLNDFLKMDWSKIHTQACRMEHSITDNLTKLFDKALNHPKTCPHGNPIPTLCGGILEEDSQPLTECNDGDKRVVVKIVREDQDVLKYLASLFLIPGARIEVIEKTPFNGPILVKIAEQIRPISRKMASIIWVKP